MSEERFKIKEFAQTFGLSADTLRYYENQGILVPQRNEQNQYRYYTEEDCSKVMNIRQLRSLGFSVQDIRNQVSMFDHIDFCRQLEKNISEVEKKIVFLKRQRERMEYYQKAADRVLSGDMVFGVEEGNFSFWFYQQMVGDHLIKSKIAASDIPRMYEYMPVVFPCCMSENMFSEGDEEIRYVYGLMIQEKDVEDIIQKEKMDCHYQWNKCLHVIVKVDLEETPYKKSFADEIYDHLNRMGLKGQGTVMSVILPMSPSSPYTYLDCFVPIE